MDVERCYRQCKRRPQAMCHLRSTSSRRGIDSWGSSSAGGEDPPALITPLQRYLLTAIRASYTTCHSWDALRPKADSCAAQALPGVEQRQHGARCGRPLGQRCCWAGQPPGVPSAAADPASQGGSPSLSSAQHGHQHGHSTGSATAASLLSHAQYQWQQAHRR